MDVVCLGELLIDLFPAETGRRLAEVSAFRPKPGGAPANVAVGLARLGAQSAFIGKVGDDPFGRHLAAVLRAEGVETRGLRFDDAARTTLAFIAVPDPDNPEFLFYRHPGADMRLRPAELDVELLQATKVLHLGSLSLAAEPMRSAAAAAIALTHAAGGRVSFDANFRPALWPEPEEAAACIKALLPQVDLLKANEAELLLLTGERDLERGSRALLEIGARACAITLGRLGSYFRVAGGTGFCPGFAVETVDATGCGDAFVAGVLSRLIARSWSDPLPEAVMEEAVVYGNAVGALAATVQGAIPSLPSAEATDRFLARQAGG